VSNSGKMNTSRTTNYYWYLSLIFLLILFIGFGPQFFWRPLTGRPPLSMLSLTHALFGVSWVVLFSMQTWFVKNNKVLNHKRFGPWMSVIALGLVLSTFGMIYRTLTEYLNTGESFMDPTGLVFGNNFAMILFVLFLGLGFKHRSRPIVHKQLMSIATIFILGPAIGRLSRYPFTKILDDFGANEGLWAVGGSVLLFISLIVFNKKKWVSISGLVAFLFSIIAVGYLVVSGTGIMLIDSLK